MGGHGASDGCISRRRAGWYLWEDRLCLPDYEADSSHRSLFLSLGFVALYDHELREPSRRHHRRSGENDLACVH